MVTSDDHVRSVTEHRQQLDHKLSDGIVYDTAREPSRAHAERPTTAKRPMTTKRHTERPTTAKMHSVSAFLKNGDFVKINARNSNDTCFQSTLPFTSSSLSPTSGSRNPSPPFVLPMMSPTPFTSLAPDGHSRNQYPPFVYPMVSPTPYTSRSLACDSRNPPPPFVSPMVSPTSFNSYLPTPSPVCMTSHMSRPTSSNHSTSEMVFTTSLSPWSSMQSPVTTLSVPSLLDAPIPIPISPSSSSSSPLSQSRHSSPGLSGSVDSGFSSPLPVEDNKQTTKVPGERENLNRTTKRRYKRNNYSDTQLGELQRQFEDNPYPASETIETIGSKVQISEKQVKIWFQNKRARNRKKQTGERSTLAQIQRIYSPMASCGNSSPATRGGIPTNPITSGLPVYLPVGQSQYGPSANAQQDKLSQLPAANPAHYWQPFWSVPVPDGNVGTSAYTHFASIQNTWQG